MIVLHELINNLVKNIGVLIDFHLNPALLNAEWMYTNTALAIVKTKHDHCNHRIIMTINTLSVNNKTMFSFMTDANK